MSKRTAKGSSSSAHWMYVEGEKGSSFARVASNLGVKIDTFAAISLSASDTEGVTTNNNGLSLSRQWASETLK